MSAVTTFLGNGIPARPASVRATHRAAITRMSRTSPRVFLRRRLAVAGLAMGLVVAAARGGAPRPPPAPRPAASARTWVEVVVRPGDSLWSIVERTFPGEDPRARVDLLARARRGVQLVPGEIVQVPR
jgi:hypothetical protein